MALTSLEAISQKLEESRTMQLEGVLSVSGSNAITKNEYGITVVDDTNVASSLVFKPLNKVKLNEVEIKKAIDVEIKELKPDIPTGNADIVPKELLDAQTAENERLNNALSALNDTNTLLSTNVQNLKAEVEQQLNGKLNTEQSNDALANQLSTLRQTIDDFAKQIQSAVQKSVDESILRASLQAQNVGFKTQVESLIKQIDSLNSIIEGLQSQLGAVQQQQALQNSVQAVALEAGGDVIGGTIIVKFKEKKANSGFPIDGNINYDNGGTRWQNGDEIILSNLGNDPVTITMDILEKIGWLKLAQNQVSLAGKETKNIKMLIVPNGTTGNLDSKQGGGKHPSPTGAGMYDQKEGFKVTVTKSDGSKSDKMFATRLAKVQF